MKSIKSRLKIIGISPRDTFSGFQNTFFDSLEMQGAEIKRIGVQLRLFKILCTIASFHPNKKKWGPRISNRYHMSIAAFNKKSAYVQKRVERYQDSADAIYQIGSLWNPLSANVNLPLFLSISAKIFIIFSFPFILYIIRFYNESEIRKIKELSALAVRHVRSALARNG